MELLQICFAIVVLSYLSGCSQHQNKNKVLSNRVDVQEEQKSEMPWFLLKEYTPTRSSDSREYEKWVQECLNDFEFIRPGVTRQEVMKRFRTDGGLTFSPSARFVHPDCIFFKIDVIFAFEKDNTYPGRDIMGKNDRVIEVSKPYIENPYFD